MQITNLFSVTFAVDVIAIQRVIWWTVQPDGSKLNTSTSDTGVLANFFNSLLVRKSAGTPVGPDGKPTGIYQTDMIFFARGSIASSDLDTEGRLHATLIDIIIKGALIQLYCVNIL